jgi:hypothetical protein
MGGASELTHGHGSEAQATPTSAADPFIKSHASTAILCRVSRDMVVLKHVFNTDNDPCLASPGNVLKSQVGTVLSREVHRYHLHH